MVTAAAAAAVNDLLGCCHCHYKNLSHWHRDCCFDCHLSSLSLLCHCHCCFTCVCVCVCVCVCITDVIVVAVVIYIAVQNMSKRLIMGLLRVAPFQWS